MLTFGTSETPNNAGVHTILTLRAAAQVPQCCFTRPYHSPSLHHRKKRNVGSNTSGTRTVTSYTKYGRDFAHALATDLPRYGWSALDPAPYARSAQPNYPVHDQTSRGERRFQVPMEEQYTSPSQTVGQLCGTCGEEKRGIPEQEKEELQRKGYGYVPRAKQMGPRSCQYSLSKAFRNRKPHVHFVSSQRRRQMIG